MPVYTQLARHPWLAGPLALAALAASGCSFFHHAAPGAPVVVAHAPLHVSAVAAPPGEAPTVTSNLPDLADAPAAAPAATAAAPTVVLADAGPALAATAPKSYVVRKGDTLWGLAQMFLKDPWQWPEIWHINPEVRNPHRIYPGDTLRLAVGADGRQQLQVDHAGTGAPVEVATPTGPVTVLHPMLREGEASAPIDVLPRAEILKFLSRPGVLAREQVDRAPYIVSLRGEHMVAGAGNDVYVRRLPPAEGVRYDVLHVGQPLKAPGVGKVGYLAQYAGTVEASGRGDPARARITLSEREVLAGDVLVPADGNELPDVVPHVPTHAVHGQLLAVVNGVLLAGQFQVVAISGGSAEGIEPGHVLRVDEAAKRVRDRCAHIEGSGTCLRFHDVGLPIESAGTLLVFRSFTHMSYALVLAEDQPLHVGDHIVRP